LGVERVVRHQLAGDLTCQLGTEAFRLVVGDQLSELDLRLPAVAMIPSFASTLQGRSALGSVTAARRRASQPVLRSVLGLLFIAHLSWKFAVFPAGSTEWWSNLGP
jgi:hypothetical protein